ncbi:hypothetical protein CEXT_400371 [Caerostris extrusa]|uniref:Uncharacterized protein n=1 Tax=Caerostris extrusa TaxID=172846 RepID=A0AAV4Q940_CAEEX|nr:hypothetical protein CEXT_400371 [Caerostris extrusa]
MNALALQLGLPFVTGMRLEESISLRVGRYDSITALGETPIGGKASREKRNCPSKQETGGKTFHTIMSRAYFIENYLNPRFSRRTFSNSATLLTPDRHICLEGRREGGERADPLPSVVPKRSCVQIEFSLGNKAANHGQCALE